MCPLLGGSTIGGSTVLGSQLTSSKDEDGSMETCQPVGFGATGGRGFRELLILGLDDDG